MEYGSGLVVVEGFVGLCCERFRLVFTSSVIRELVFLSLI